MKKGYLSTYFSGVAIKKLSQVEVEPLTSHQHEFNGVNGLKKNIGIGKSHRHSSEIYLFK